MPTKAAPSLKAVTYARPTRDDMAVLMVMFNPTGSIRIQQNWLFVWNKCRAAGIPVFGAELLFPWQSVGLAPEFRTLTVRTDSIMFHKEKLLSRLTAEVPPQYTKLCCIDCDVVFARPDWYDAVSAALDEVPVVQPYATCHWLAGDLKTPIMSNPSAASQLDMIRAAHATGTTTRLTGHPGFAMAMRREIPLCEWAVVGGGDAVFFRAVTGLVEEFADARMAGLMSRVWVEYAPTVRGSIGVVDGAIFHMWHGPLSGRQYYDRYVKFMAALPVGIEDIRELLVENADGVWTWRADVKNALNTMMLRYFAGRDDDALQ